MYIPLTVDTTGNLRAGYLFVLSSFSLLFVIIMEGLSSPVLYSFAILVPCLFFLIDYFLGAKLDPKEPPLVPSTIPYVGHLIGMIRRRTRYLVDVRYEEKAPADEESRRRHG